MGNPVLWRICRNPIHEMDERLMPLAFMTPANHRPRFRHAEACRMRAKRSIADLPGAFLRMAASRAALLACSRRGADAFYFHLGSFSHGANEWIDRRAARRVLGGAPKIWPRGAGPHDAPHRTFAGRWNAWQ